MVTVNTVAQAGLSSVKQLSNLIMCKILMELVLQHSRPSLCLWHQHLRGLLVHFPAALLLIQLHAYGLPK